MTTVFDAIEIETFTRGDGIDHRVAVRAATTAAVSLIANLDGSTIDGVTLSAGDRLLVKDQAPVAEITNVVTTGSTGAGVAGKYFTINSASGTGYYVWFNTGASVDPAPGGLTGLEVGVGGGDNDAAVAAAIRTDPDVTAVFTTGGAGTTATLTDMTTGPVDDAADVDTGFTITTITAGTDKIDNGIYVIGTTNGAGADPTVRSEDLTTGDDASFVFVNVQEGTAYKKTEWTCQDLTGSAIVDSDPLNWVMSKLYEYAANDLFYATSATEMDNLTSVADRVLVTDGSGNITWGDTLPSGTLIVGPFNEFSSGDSIVNKTYVDSLAAGLDPKESVRVGTLLDLSGTYTDNANPTPDTITSVDLTDTSNIELTDPVEGTIVLAVGDRILVKNQTDPKQNGIYEVTTAGVAGALKRAPDQDGISPPAEVSGGNHTYVENGTTLRGSGWVVIGDEILTLNTDDIVWTQFSSLGSFTGGDGIDITGSVISADLFANGGVVFQGSTPNGQLRVDVGATSILGTLAVVNGGTGFSSYSDNDILIGNGSGTLDKLGNGGFPAVLTTNLAGDVGWRNDVHLNNILGDSAAEPELIAFVNSNAAVNHLQISNALTGADPKLKAVGGDADVNLDLMSKGTGDINVMGDTNPGQLNLFNEADTFSVGLRAATVAEGLTADLTFRLPTADGTADGDVLVTDASGNLRFDNPDKTSRRSYHWVPQQIKATSPGFATVAYFAWKISEYQPGGAPGYTSGKIVFEADISNRDLTVQVYNTTTATALGTSAAISADGWYELAFTLPTADARIALRVKKSMGGGSNPKIYGVQIEFNS